MILWSGDQIHEAAQRWIEATHREFVPEQERCVGCDENRATETGWCLECWASIEPPTTPVPILGTHA